MRLKLLLISFIIISVIVNIYLLTKKSDVQYLYRTDTSIVTRYTEKVKRDTVIRWYEKPFFRISEPENILVQKADSSEVEKYNSVDLILQIEKKKDKLNIYTLNRSQRTFKEFKYEGIHGDFTATSSENNIVIKSKNFGWYLSGFVSLETNLNENKKFINYEPKYKAGISGSIEFGKLNAEAGLFYSFFYNKAGIEARIRINIE